MNHNLSGLKNKSSCWRRIFPVLAVILLLLVVGSAGFLYSKGWLHRTFRAGESAQKILEEENREYKMERLEAGTLAFVPDQPQYGLIFYPGGLVEQEAYLPLMDALANEHVLCILLKPKSGLPMFEAGIADGKADLYSDLVSTWYIGGHSMGGLTAASYVAEHVDEFTGLILLASYSSKDLTQSNLKVLCAYGTEDGVMNHQMYEDNKTLLPEDYTELVIEGGCHSYFGDYGVKGGDGKPAITMEEQCSQTVQAILTLMNH